MHSRHDSLVWSLPCHLSLLRSSGATKGARSGFDEATEELAVLPRDRLEDGSAEEPLVVLSCCADDDDEAAVAVVATNP
jgi:hypothetical protein